VLQLPEGGIFAKLRITPVGPFSQLVETFTLSQSVGGGWIVRCISRDRFTHEVKRKSRKLDPRDVESQIDKLETAKIPVLLKGEMPLDGEHVELTVYAPIGTLSISWWTIVPKGAEALGDFAGWLRKSVSDAGNTPSNAKQKLV
jgi:hypothetical protein